MPLLLCLAFAMLMSWTSKYANNLIAQIPLALTNPEGGDDRL